MAPVKGSPARRLGRRVSAAQHLGVLLGGSPAPAPEREAMEEVASALGDWREEALRAELEAQDGPLPPDAEGLTDFQKDYLAARASVLASLTPDERARLADAFAIAPGSLP
jgi:hypothetical protein